MTTTQAQQIRTFADAEQVLAKALPGYTERPQQQALAAFVEEVIATGGHGLAEAGCGTGKSLATVIPAVLSGKKTVIATATIALMEQYANKDVPFLEEHLPVDFTWALLKGRSNYLCLAKANDPDTNRAFVPLDALMRELDANPEHTGDREHFTTPVTKQEFSNVASTAAECPGKRDCPFGDVCYAEAAKQKAQASQVVITNTAMLMTDLKVREMTDGYAAMLGDYELVLIDEGHETEEIATNALESEVRPNGVTKMIGEAMSLSQSQGVTLSSAPALSSALTEAWGHLEEQAEKDAKERGATRLALAWFMERAEEFITLVEALKAFADEVGDIAITRGGDREEAKRNRLVKRAKNYVDTIGMAVSTDDEMLVRWVEKIEMRRGDDQVLLKTAPVHVGSYLAQWLWDRVPAVLISATLSVHGDFGYIEDRLGLPETTQALDVGTPFDYDSQALLFIPKDGTPWPSKQRAAWMSYAQMATADLIRASKGGALLLFTSRQAMTEAYETLSQMFSGEGINFYMQGQDSNKMLAQKFSEDTHSVLFALKSYFTGVDFQGDTCRLVVIDKMPFPVPTEPVFAARADQIKRHGGSDFQDLTIPMMTLTLQQGYGRAIRTVEDRAVIAILDPRLTTGWGGKIVRGLPASPKTNDMAVVREFYSRG